MSQAPLLRATGITRRVRDGAGTVAILDQISLQIDGGERLVLLGPSGSGKSSLLHVLGALEPDYEGSVAVQGAPLEQMADSARARLRNRVFGFVFQAYNLLGQLTSLQNVLLVAQFSNDAPDEARGREVLSQVGLSDRADRLPQTLSGGERQRVAIARAIYQRPELVFCDEPTGNLDAETAVGILRLFDQLRNSGVALLIATHDEAIARSADRTLSMRAGALS